MKLRGEKWGDGVKNEFSLLPLALSVSLTLQVLLQEASLPVAATACFAKHVQVGINLDTVQGAYFGCGFIASLGHVRN